MNRIGFLFSVLFLGFVFRVISSPSAQIEVFEKQQPDTTVIYLKDYGLEKTRKRDCTDIINKALKEIDNDIPTVIKFSRGEYHFFPGESTKRSYSETNSPNTNLVSCALLFENRKNIIIDGNGSTLIFHEQMQPFTFDSCQNIILKNISIDWEQPLTAQGKVVKVNDNFIELAVDLKESPYQVGEDGILYFTINRNEKEPWRSTMEFDRENGYIVPQTGDLGCLGNGWENYVAENIIPGVIRLNYAFLRKPAIGNYLVLRHNQHIQSGIFIQNSQNISIQNVNLYYTAGPGVQAQFSKNLTFDGVKAIPNKAKNRYFGGDGSGLQISNCKGEIKVTNCEFAGLMNSPINIQSTIKNNDTTENPEPKPDVSITNSQFKSSRSSGILISTPGKVVIKNNEFESSGSAILITGVVNNGVESGAVTDVLIDDNEFSDLCNTSIYANCEGIISVYPEIPELNEKTPQYHRNIRIINNRFNPFDYPILYARSVDGLTFENNTITRSTQFEPFHAKKYAFTFEGCKHISIKNNAFSEDVLGKNILLKEMPANELNCSQPELTIKLVKVEE